MLTMTRAYVAASRRTDRSLDKRVQSARDASKVHKANKGRALNITVDLVAKQGMYEEVEDHKPQRDILKESGRRLAAKEREFFQQLSAAMNPFKFAPLPQPQQVQPQPQPQPQPQSQPQPQQMPQVQPQQMPLPNYMLQGQLDEMSLFMMDPQQQIQEMQEAQQMQQMQQQPALTGYPVPKSPLASEMGVLNFSWQNQNASPMDVDTSSLGWDSSSTSSTPACNPTCNPMEIMGMNPSAPDPWMPTMDLGIDELEFGITN